MKQILSILIVLVLTPYINAQDWPDWRGVNRDGVWNDDKVTFDLKSLDTTPVWSLDIGPGYSGPTVANGKVYVTDKPDSPESNERVLCVDEKNGEIIWQYKYACEYSGVGYPAGPRASVVIADEKAYSLGTMGNLFCFDANSGGIIWQRDLKNDYDINMPIWGIAATPLIDGNKIFVHVSGNENACVVAFNKNTGEEIWRNLNDRAGYSAPIMIEKNGVRVLVNWTEDSLSGLNPETGKVYWRFPWKTGSGMSIATPVLYGDQIFVSAFYSGSLLVNLGNDYTTAEKVWQRCGESERKTDALHCVMNTPVIIDNYIYGVDSYGELRCLELATGNRVWENQTAVKRGRWANIHFIQNKNKTWMFNEQGELLITELLPKGMNEISRVKIIETTRKQLPRGVTWSHPAFANHHIFVRNDNKLISIDLSK